VRAADRAGPAVLDKRSGGRAVESTGRGVGQQRRAGAARAAGGGPGSGRRAPGRPPTGGGSRTPRTWPQWRPRATCARSRCTGCPGADPGAGGAPRL